MKQPILTATGEKIHSESPEDDLIAKVYSNPELAQLFAAALDLLEALEGIGCLPDGWCCRPSDRREDRERHVGECAAARAAIAKATGKPPWSGEIEYLVTVRIEPEFQCKTHREAEILAKEAIGRAELISSINHRGSKKDYYDC